MVLVILLAVTVLTINIDKPSGFPVDLTLDYVVYDDAWATLWCPSNCETCEAYEIGEACDGSIYTVGPTDASGQLIHKEMV